MLDQAPIMRLPTAMLAQVLSHVPQQQRLQVCALVHTSWATAAAAATTAVAAVIGTDKQLESVEAWTRQHGSQLVSLSLSLSPDVDLVDTRVAFAVGILDLPLAELVQLSSLQLSRMTTEMQEASSKHTASIGSGVGAAHQDAAGPAAGPPRLPLLPRLVSVVLNSCTFTDAGSLMQLAAATGITRLKLSSVLCARCCHPSDTPSSQPPAEQDMLYTDNAAGAHQRLGRTLAALLQCLTQLQHLSMEQYPFRSLALALEGAPSSLRDLVVTGDRAPADEGGQSCLPPRLLQLTRLTSLTLLSAAYHPAVLADLPQLRALDCAGCAAVAGSESHGPAGNHGGAASAAVPNSLLSALARLTCMESLSLCNCANGFASEPAERFSALTAGTGLDQLVVIQDGSHTLPPRITQHMFPPGRRLQALTMLKLEQDAWDFAFMAASDLRCVISACPALQVLGIYNVLQEEAAAAELLRLPQCCRDLSVGGEAFADAAAGVVAQLTQLTLLQWKDSPYLTDTGLEQLTALKALWGLIMRGNTGISQELFPRDNPYDAVILHSCASAGKAPKELVWQQLDRACDRSPLCAPARLAALQEAHAMCAARSAALQQRVEGLERQLSETRGQLAEAQGRLAE